MLADPAPFWSSTFTATRSASGASPLILPLESLPLPSAMPATCVPWPLSSYGRGLAVHQVLESGQPAVGLPACLKSLLGYTPVSSTAMRTPVPFTLRRQSRSAPTVCGPKSPGLEAGGPLPPGVLVLACEPSRGRATPRQQRG